MAESVFKDKVVVITGASSGIGRELAYQLAAQGAWLALAARNTERLAGVRTECQGRGGKAVAISTDVSESAQCNKLVFRHVAPMKWQQGERPGIWRRLRAARILTR